MARTIFYTATSLDGFLADEHHSLEWLFEQDQDEDGPMSYAPFRAGIGAMLTGATTYEWVLEHDGSWPFTLPTTVLTHRQLPVPADAQGPVRFASADDDAALRAVHADVVEQARASSDPGQDVWCVGGGGLAADLAAIGLLDELVLNVAPVSLGAGAPLLPRPIDLELLEVDRNQAFACLRYAVRGPR